MRTFLKFCVGLIVLGLVISTFLSVLPAFATMGKTLLISVQQKRFNDAYLMFSDDFRKKYTITEFANIFLETGLDKYENIQWVKENTSDDQKTGYVMGLVTIPQKGTVILEIDFVKESTVQWFGLPVWQMSAIQVRTPQSMISADAPEKK